MFKRLYLLFAISIFLPIISSNTLNANIYVDELNKSIDLYESKQFDESSEILDGLIKSGNLDEQSLTRAFLYRGLSNYENSKYIASITDLTNSLWLDLLNDDEKKVALETRANAREKIGQVDLANQDKNTAKEISEPNNNMIDEGENIINLEDLNAENRINNLKNKFSMNVSNFFGSKNIDGVELPSSDYVISDQEVYDNILKYDQNLSENYEESNILNEEFSKENDISKDEFLVSDNQQKVTLDEPVPSSSITKLNSSYIILNRDLDLPTAKVKINKTINDNFRVLSGIRPQSIEKIDDNGNIKYDIIIGPFTNQNRIQEISKSLENNNYNYEIEILN
jgi:hypothetical protein